MIFRPMIERWGFSEMAADLDLPTKNIRRWWDNDSIPAEWFAAVVRAARRRGESITAASLAQLAEQRRIARTGEAA